MRFASNQIRPTSSTSHPGTAPHVPKQSGIIYRLTLLVVSFLMQPSKNCSLCAYELIISKVVCNSSGSNQQTIRSQASDFKYSIQQCQVST